MNVQQEVGVKVVTAAVSPQFSCCCRVESNNPKILISLWKVWFIVETFLTSRKTFLSPFQENAGLVVPWLIGILTFISFEALGLVYANVLKDQIFGVSFDNTPRPRSTQDCKDSKTSLRDLMRRSIIITTSISRAFIILTTENFFQFSPTAFRHFRQDRAAVLPESSASKCKKFNWSHKNVKWTISAFLFPFSVCAATAVAGNVGCYEILSHVTFRHLVENKWDNYRALT